ncbi:hypothetical protein [Bowmanella yangjiangensis]|uniref:Uncharacterized protein n=1 Tax=Bowmanella yangjiangensis TaxID=2811230 RepID=A0ABS3CTG3_9ALTE|nr:hypothetical protein [Bowmanella yangjiangensis]MBN7819915.1 hypothetical protein [Bowmanella yangjiangensis]
MEIGSASGTNVQNIQPQPRQEQPESRQADQQQRQAELEVQRSEPDPNQRVGSQINTQA